MGRPPVLCLQRTYPFFLKGPIEKMHVGTTCRTGIRLSMKAPVERIVVFCLAGRAHGKDAHSRLVTVVGYILDNRKAWATVCAVDERIAVAPISGIEELT